jgi:hypothetical protein
MLMTQLKNCLRRLPACAMATADLTQPTAAAAAGRTWSCGVAPHSSQGVAEEGAHRLLASSGRQTTHVHTARVAGGLLGVRSTCSMRSTK